MRRESAAAWGLAVAGWTVALWALLRPAPAPDALNLAAPARKDATADAAEAPVRAASPRLASRPPEAAPAAPEARTPAPGSPQPAAEVAPPPVDLSLLLARSPAGGARPLPIDPATVFSLPDDAPSLARIAGDLRETGERRAAALATLSAVDVAEAVRLTEDLLGRDEASREVANRVLDGASDRAFLPLLARRARADGAASHRHLDALARLKDRPWSALQATGEPDTPVGGDLPTAWASRQADMGPVWLVLGYDQPMRPDVVVVRESFQPGAVAEIAARAPDGTWETLWSGEATPGEAPRDFAPALRAVSWRTKEVRVVLETDRVAGWNEIDAVALEEDGRRQWATSARASSSYANSW